MKTQNQDVKFIPSLFIVNFEYFMFCSSISVVAFEQLILW